MQFGPADCDLSEHRKISLPRVGALFKIQPFIHESMAMNSLDFQ